MLSATDIANLLACRQLLALELDETAGKIRKPFFHDLGVDLLRELGNRHEDVYLNQLKEKRGKVEDDKDSRNLRALPTPNPPIVKMESRRISQFLRDRTVSVPPRMEN